MDWHNSEYGWIDNFSMLIGPVSIPAAAICAPTERGEIMFHTLASRQAQHALDMDAASLVKPRTTSHSPDVVDENEHVPPAVSGPLLSESWYFDATTADGELGVYARIGRLPNQDYCNFVGGIFRRNCEPIMFVDMSAPLPESDPRVQTFSTPRFSVESKCLSPLKTFSLKIRGTGSALSDPSGPLRGEGGRDVEDVRIDLVWETSAQAYKKKGQTRYEIPCRVSGSIQIGETSYQLNAAPGQRNHSWGVRNWWVADWVWSGIHLSDGTDIFTIALGKGDESTGPAGYIQKNNKLTEITSVRNDFDWRDNGLPGNLHLFIEPGSLSIECEATSESGLRLIDPDGREAHLPRVMCSVRTGDGRTGVGWLDFNHVVKKQP